MGETLSETSTTPTWLLGLNAAQMTAVMHDAGPLLVVAGAGSGKTRTLASRVARLLDEGNDPDRILLLTFTRRAAKEMLARSERLASGPGVRAVWGGTFHAIANRTLRMHGSEVGLAPGFTVLDATDSADLFGVVRDDLKLASGRRRFPKKETLASIYSRMVNARRPLSEILKQHYPHCIEEVDGVRAAFAGYTGRKRNQNIVDFDDLLLYWNALSTSSQHRQHFDHILVDEYQDTNALQAEIIYGVAALGSSVTVVGDDAQAIYGFRAASADNLSSFAEHYEGATVVTLDQNYRSTPEILDISNRVMLEASSLFPKELWSVRSSGDKPRLITCVDEQSQADWVCDRVLELREDGIELRDQAVLFRTGHHSAGLELELARRNIPFVKFGGLKFLEAAHLKDLLAMLRVLDNPRDELAWHRTLSMVEGMGKVGRAKLLDDLGITQDPAQALKVLLDKPPKVSSRATESFDLLREALGLAASTGSNEPPVAEQIATLIDFCSHAFTARYDDSDVRLEDLEQLSRLAVEHNARGIFLSELTLDPPVSTSDLAQPPLIDDDYLILSTIHSSKGMEWKNVHLIHAADGNIPSDMALGDPGGLDEERRLMYVALTRAKDHLSVSYPVRFYHRRMGMDDSHSYGQLSRFLLETRPLFKESTAGDGIRADGTVFTVVKPDAVRDTLADLWEG